MRTAGGGLRGEADCLARRAGSEHSERQSPPLRQTLYLSDRKVWQVFLVMRWWMRTAGGGLRGEADCLARRAGSEHSERQSPPPSPPYSRVRIRTRCMTGREASCALLHGVIPLVELKTLWKHPSMGIYDRDYMKAPSARPPVKKASLWQRFRFWLWTVFKQKKSRR